MDYKNMSQEEIQAQLDKDYEDSLKNKEYMKEWFTIAGNPDIGYIFSKVMGIFFGDNFKLFDELGLMPHDLFSYFLFLADRFHPDREEKANCVDDYRYTEEWFEAYGYPVCDIKDKNRFYEVMQELGGYDDLEIYLNVFMMSIMYHDTCSCCREAEKAETCGGCGEDISNMN